MSLVKSIYMHKPISSTIPIPAMLPKPKWMPRRLFTWILDWAKDHEYRNEETVTVMRMSQTNEQKIIDKVFDHVDAVWGGYNIKPDTLIMGRYEFHQMTGEWLDPKSPCVSVRIESEIVRYVRQVFGLNLIVLPYINE